MDEQTPIQRGEAENALGLNFDWLNLDSVSEYDRRQAGVGFLSTRSRHFCRDCDSSEVPRNIHWLLGLMNHDAFEKARGAEQQNYPHSVVMYLFG